MGMPNQGMKLPTTGTTTTPNGRTFNTNPAANQMMADRARMAREQRMQPSPQGMGQIGGYNPPSPPNMAQYEAMQKDIAKQRESTSAQDPARFLRQRDIEDSANQRVAYMGPQAAQGGMGQAQQSAAMPNQEPIRRTPMTFAQQQAQDQAMMQAKMQAAQQQAPQAVQSGMGGMGGKGGQPPSPQQLGQGLQQQAMMQGQMPYRGASASQMFGMQAPQQQGQMSGQGQPQGRMPPQMPMRGRR